MRRGLIGSIALLGALAFSLMSYADLPARVPIHWNLRWEADGYASPFTAAVIIPTLFLLLPVLAWGLPRIDPLRRNHERHARAWWITWNATMALIAAVQTLLIASARGWPIEVSTAAPLLVGALFVVTGNYLPQVRPNWFLGIRTPWTLSSDEVWRRTHRFGARTLVIAGLLLGISVVIAEGALRTVMSGGALLLAVVSPVIYSYVVWKRSGKPTRSRADARTDPGNAEDPAPAGP